MFNFRKALLTACTLGVSVISHASDSYNANNVTIPCETKGWSFGVDALYVNTNNIGSVTASQSATEEDSYISAYTAVNSLSSNWQWGFRMALDYNWSTGNDISVNWTHFVHSDTSTISSEPIITDNSYSTVQGLLLFKGGNLTSPEAINTVATNIGNNFDAVNFELGQLTHWGDKVSTRLYAGIQYASIQQTVNQTGWNTADSNVYDQTNAQSQFDGIGPRVGINTTYNIINHVSLFGNVALGILVGDLSFNGTQTFTADDSAVVSALQENNSATTDNTLTPEAEAELGIRYMHALSEGNLSAEIGYTIANYWNAAATESNSSYNGGYMSEEITNFSYQGLIFGLKWQGNF